MSNFSNVFKKLRTDNNYTQQDLATKIGVSRSAIGMYENGEREPDFETMEAIADFFNVDMDYLHGRTSTLSKPLLEYDNILPIAKRKFPLLGEIACGEPIFANEDRESYVLAGTDIDADFCVQARGDSMIGARILDGDIVFIKEASIVNNGEIAAVAIDNEVMLKRFYYFRDENVLTLQSENPKYPPKNYTNEQLDHVTVLGRAVGFQSDVI